jgi:hypothetical protein
MSIAEGYMSNLETLKRAARYDALVLAECTDKVTGKPVIALCAISHQGTETVLAPLAKMFDGDPYEELNQPGETHG